ncbi:restriction endonuclease subunit S [Psittacicella hinzii]|uniref:Type I restriction modification DNA specificity domain-containing protein n=1 Tax=Psittacicella hinzii TaxID=2028575 RepID=A0A3A1YVI0_9GAMM|nr:restriction endonuclease subunit S [Psittacicella hinzii]RIY40464.1 hypothetical protein CKF58_00490 [Psittacicella hinzii]
MKNLQNPIAQDELATQFMQQLAKHPAFQEQRYFVRLQDIMAAHRFVVIPSEHLQTPQENKQQSLVPVYKISYFTQQDPKACSYVTLDYYQRKLAHRKPLPNAVIITAVGTVGHVLRYNPEPDNKHIYYSSNFIYFDNDEKYIINDFLYYYLRTINWSKQAVVKGQGTALNSLYARDLYDIRIPLIAKQHQQEIVNLLRCFEQVDQEAAKLHAANKVRFTQTLRTIFALLQNQSLGKQTIPADIAQLVNPKQQYEAIPLQQIGAGHRFNAINRSHMVTEIPRGLSVDDYVPFYNLSDFSGIGASERRAPQYYIAKQIFVSSLKKSVYPRAGSILLSASGTIGKPIIKLACDEYFSNHFIWVDNNEKIISNQFLYYFYLSKERWETIGASATIRQIYIKRHLLPLQVPLISLAQQAKITNYLSLLEQTVTASQEYVDCVLRRSHNLAYNIFYFLLTDAQDAYEQLIAKDLQAKQIFKQTQNCPLDFAFEQIKS